MSRSTIRELAALLHCEALAMLNAFFDESGTHGYAKVTAIAGYVGTVDQWDRVEGQWQEILAPYAPLGLTWWHMADFPDKGQLKNVGRAKSEVILKGLVRVIRESELQVIWAGVDSEAYAAVTTPEWRERYAPKPYDFCFFWIIRQLYIWNAQRGHKDRIGMVFAVQDEYNERSKMTLDSWQRAGLLEQLDSIAFGYPKTRPALQPADMLVHEVYRLWLQYAQDKSANKLILPQLLQDITRSGLKEGGFATELTIKNYMTNPNWVSPGLRGVSE